MASEPPPVPERREPPPVPGNCEPTTRSRDDGPPPIPGNLLNPSTAGSKLESTPVRKNEEVSFVLEGSASIESAGPVQLGSRQPPEVPVEIELEIVGDGSAHKSSFPVWLALSLSIACLPLSIGAALWPVFGVELWPFVLICSLVAMCVGRYVRSEGGPSANLARLAVQLAYGFFVIALVGLGLILLEVTAGVSSALHATAKSVEKSATVAQWFTEQVDSIKAYFAGHGSSAPPALPSPTPAATTLP